MNSLLLLGLLATASPPATLLASSPSGSTLAPSAQIDTPPSPAKLLLIRRYLRAIGLQSKLDSGNFLERYAVPGGPMWKVSPGAKSDTLMGGFERRFAALKQAYAKRRNTYQQAYESHVNWEFTEAELAQIVGFLERPVGQHYLDGRWRMEAYLSDDTDQWESEMIAEAMANLAK